MVLNAPYPSRMDTINNASIVTMGRTETNAILRNRADVIVADLVIRNDPALYVEALRRIGSFDSQYRDVVIKDWYLRNAPNAKIADPVSLLSTQALYLKWSPDGVYLATTINNTNPLSVYKKSGDVLTKLTNPPSQPTNAPGGVAWSPDGQYLMLVGQAPPYVNLYKRSGDSFTAVPTPPVLPTLAAFGVSWSPDGNYVAISHESTVADVNFTVYRRSGETFSAIAGPSAYEIGLALTLEWSADGRYLAVATTSSKSKFVVYSFQNEKFTRLPDPAVLPIYSNSLSWSPNSQYLAIASFVGPLVYKRSGSNLTKLDYPSVSPFNTTQVNWSPDGQYLVCTGGPGFRALVFKRTGDFFRLVSSPDLASLGVTYCNDATWTPDGNYLAISHQESPYFSVWKSASGPISGPAIRTQIVP